MRTSKPKIVVTAAFCLIVAVAVLGFWRTPITRYQPRNEVEHALRDLFIKYINSRNSRDVDQFLSTLHQDCSYLVEKDHVATKEQLSVLLPGLWTQNDTNDVPIAKCNTWECINENLYKSGMLVNPKFKIAGNRAEVECKFVSGIFMDDNFFELVRENGRWWIVRFSRRIY